MSSSNGTMWRLRTLAIATAAVLLLAAASVGHHSSAVNIPYSPDFSPIELTFAKLKAKLQNDAERIVGGLWMLIGVEY